MGWIFSLIRYPALLLRITHFIVLLPRSTEHCEIPLLIAVFPQYHQYLAKSFACLPGSDKLLKCTT